MEPDAQQALLDAIQQADRAGARAVIEAWAETHPFERVVPDLLSPTLETFGRLWAHRKLGFSLATGYVAAKVAEDVLARLLEEAGARGEARAPLKGPVVLGNVEDDFHPLGRKMVGAFLRADGWDVQDLGVDVNPARFIEAAEACGARVIGASAMMYTTAKNAARLREAMEQRGLAGRVQLALGGAVFKLRPELVATFGGDGTAPSALEAPALFAELWQRASILAGEVEP